MRKFALLATVFWCLGGVACHKKGPSATDRSETNQVVNERYQDIHGNFIPTCPGGREEPPPPEPPRRPPYRPPERPHAELEEPEEEDACGCQFENPPGSGHFEDCPETRPCIEGTDPDVDVSTYCSNVEPVGVEVTEYLCRFTDEPGADATQVVSEDGEPLALQCAVETIENSFTAANFCSERDGECPATQSWDLEFRRMSNCGVCQELREYGENWIWDLKCAGDVEMDTIALSWECQEKTVITEIPGQPPQVGYELTDGCFNWAEPGEEPDCQGSCEFAILDPENGCQPVSQYTECVAKDPEDDPWDAPVDLPPVASGRRSRR